MAEGDGTIEILLAEDERVLREALASMFGAAGFSVRAVANGAQAVETFRAHRPDAVVLDVMMPVLDGYAACREMRRLDREVPVVFLSALDRDEHQIKGLEAGADDYVSKLASPEMLVARVRSALARARRFAAREAPSAMTKTEANIYRLLKAGRGRLFSYREIFTAVLGEGYYADEGSLRSHISHLRRKLPKDERIEARRGLGFYMVSADAFQQGASR